MKLHTLAIATACLAAAAAAGCVGIIDDGPVGSGGGGTEPDAGGGGGGANARADFDQNVVPILAACSPSGCHSGTGTNPLRFLGPSSESSTWYDAVVAQPLVTGAFDSTKATLISKITPGNHQGMSYSADDIAKLTAWLAAELTARGPGSDSGPGATSALEEWSGCMTIANWNAANMGAWADKGAEGDAVCGSCHFRGLMGFDTSLDPTEMFERNRYEVFIRGFFALSGTDVVPAFDKLRSKGQGDNSHPTFLVGNATDGGGDIHFESLQQFYTLTKAAKDAGSCGAPGFPTPP